MVIYHICLSCKLIQCSLCVCVCVFKECVNNKKRTVGDRINQVKVHIENQFDALKASHQRLF